MINAGCFAEALPGAAVKELTGGWSGVSSGVKAALIVLGVLIVVSAIFFIWASVFRKTRKRHHSYDRFRKSKSAEAKKDRHEHQHHRPGVFRRKKRHRRHHRERPRNPTLSETGGLPPVRSPHDPAPPA